MSSPTKAVVFLLTCLLLSTSAAQEQAPASDVDALVKKLRNRTDRGGFGCMEAARALGELGDARAVDPLIDALNDPSLRNEIARASVLEALAEIGDPRAVEPLIAFLERNRDRGFLGCRVAIEALGNFADARAVAVLTSCLEGRNPALRRYAVEALANIEDPSATDVLAQYERGRLDHSPADRIAGDAMDNRRRRIGIYDLVERFKAADNEQKGEVRLKLVEAGVLAVQPLCELLTELNGKAEKAERGERYAGDGDSRQSLEGRQAEMVRVRAEITEKQRAARKAELESQRTALLAERRQLVGRLQQVESRLRYRRRVSSRDRAAALEERQKLLARLQEIDPVLATVNTEAGEYRQRIVPRPRIPRRADPRSQDVRGRRLNVERQNDYALQKAVIDVLAEIGDPYAIESIARSLGRHDEPVRLAARQALMTFGPAAVLPLLELLDRHRYEWPSANTIIEFIVEIGPAAVGPLVGMLAQDRSPTQEVPDILARIGDRRAIEPLIACFTERDKHGPNLVSPQAQALAHFKDPRVAETLIDHLRRHGRKASPAVAQALGQLADKRAIDPLRACLDDPSSPLALTAGIALLKLSGPAAVPSVAPLVDSWGTHSELITFLTLHGWKPGNKNEEVYLWLALDREKLFSHWDQAKEVLLVPPDYHYNLFLQLRKHDPEVIQALVSLLRTDNSPPGLNQKSLAEHYVQSSDHPDLVVAGLRWHSEHDCPVELWLYGLGGIAGIPELLYIRPGSFDPEVARKVRDGMGPKGDWR